MIFTTYFLESFILQVRDVSYWKVWCKLRILASLFLRASKSNLDHVSFLVVQYEALY